MGPPTLPSKSWLVHGGLRGDPSANASGVPPGAAFKKKFAEFSFVLRKASETPPCQSLPPDLVVTMIAEPEFRPNSAFMTPVTARTSATAFGETYNAARSAEFVIWLFAYAPSSMVLFE